MNVAFFLQWPTPNLVAKTSGAYSDAMGVDVNWTDFTTGTAMTEAMLAGDIDISYIHGLAPFVSVLGPSGCGKTTLLNAIAGFVPPRGQARLGEKVIDGPGVERGMVFQQGALFEWLSVSRNVDYGLRMRGNDKKDNAKLVEKWLDIVGLQGFGDTPTYQLSDNRALIAAILIPIFLMAFVWSIYYGRKQGRLKENDEVFGDPVRTKGGWYWAVCGVSTLFLVWF